MSAQLRVFLTGGSGFIGSHLYRRLGALGHTVLNYDPRSRPEDDIFNSGRLQEAVSTFKPDLIYHLASLVGVEATEKVPGYVIRVNLEGMLHLLRAVQESRLRPGLVFTSSSEVYGRNPSHRVMAEDDPKVPISFYGSAKLACEAILQAYKDEGLVRPVITRLFNVYGPHQVPEFVVMKFIMALLRGEAPVVHRRGVQTRCFTYIDDIVEGLVKAGKWALGPEYGEGPNVFNLGNTEEIKIRDLALYLCALIDPAIEPCFMDGADDRPVERDPDRRVPDVSRAWQWLGWQPRTSWFKGVESTVRWARGHFRTWAEARADGGNGRPERVLEAAGSRADAVPAGE